MADKNFDEREKIINAARRLVMADGIFMVTLEDIVKDAGVSKEVFKKYFKDRDEIIIELVSTRFGIINDELLQMPLREKIKTFNIELMKQVELADVETCRRWVIFQFGAEKKTFDNDFEHMKIIIKSSVSKGELKSDTPVEELARFCINSLYGLIFNWAVYGKEFEPLYHIEAVSDFIVNAMIPYMSEEFL